MQKTLDRFFKAIETISAVLLYVLTAVAFYQLLSRYLFSTANAGVDELVRLAFVWVVSFGSALAFRAKAHLGITALVDRIPEHGREYAGVLINLILTAFFVTVVAAGIGMARMGMKQYSEYLRLSMVYFYACIPVGAVICIIVFLEDIWQSIAKIRGNPIQTAVKEG